MWPRTREIPAGLIEKGLPRAVLEDYAKCLGEQKTPGTVNFELGCTILLVAYGSTWEGKIFFRGPIAVDNRWNGNSAKLLVEEPYRAEIMAETAASWWPSSLPDKTGEITPWIKVALPMNREHLHQTIRVRAMVDVHYPEGYWGAEGCIGSCFVNKRTHLERDIQFFVVSPDEYAAMREAFPEANKAALGFAVILAIVGFIGLVGSVAGMRYSR